MKQWMLRITDVRRAARSRISTASTGPTGTLKAQTRLDRPVDRRERRVRGRRRRRRITVFTTRPDTLFGGTYVVLAPEHPLVDAITTPAQRAAVAAYREEVGKRSERDRTTEAADAPKTGVFTGAFAMNPVNGEHDPDLDRRLRARELRHRRGLRVPGARRARPRVREEVRPADRRGRRRAATSQAAPYTGDGPHVNSQFLDGLDIDGREGEGDRAGSRSSSLGDEHDPLPAARLAVLAPALLGRAVPDLSSSTTARSQLVPEDELPVALPQIDEYKPTRDGQPPLARATDWLHVRSRTGSRARETNTMPQWAGSCWYYLRFLSPDRDDVAWDRGRGEVLDAGRPLRRRHRARDAAPALRALLAQGAVRRRPGARPRSRSSACSTRG